MIGPCRRSRAGGREIWQSPRCKSEDNDQFKTTIVIESHVKKHLRLCSLDICWLLSPASTPTLRSGIDLLLSVFFKLFQVLPKGRLVSLDRFETAKDFTLVGFGLGNPGVKVMYLMAR
jgi:hypothetical protein